MSHLKRDMLRKRLQHLLERADDEAFCQMVWAVDAIQSNREEGARAHLSYPREAVTDDLSSKFAVFKWDLETLVTLLLTTPKDKKKDGRRRFTDCRNFGTGADAVNFLRNLENEESGIYLKGSFTVLHEMHRIAQRQFPWQRGYFDAPTFYRYAYIYGQGNCAKYFLNKYGISHDKFSFVGLGIFASFQSKTSLPPSINSDVLGMTPAMVDAALKLICAPIEFARKHAVELLDKATQNRGAPLPVAYRPSLLRKFPVIAFGPGRMRLRSPLPQLIAQRITSGVYYDLVSGGSDLRNEASERFERYSAELTAAMMSRFRISRSFRYQVSGNQIDAPDIFVEYNDALAIVIECKATKLTFSAQFSDDPIEEANREYQEIAKGAFQLWRYFSHARRGIAPQPAQSKNAMGLVLTLDTWLAMSKELRDEVLKIANEMADASADILTEDRRPIVFCSIQDFELSLSISSEDSLLKAISEATKDKFLGWTLPSVHREISGKNGADRKPFPFDLGDVLKWWKDTEGLRDEHAKKRTAAIPG